MDRLEAMRVFVRVAEMGSFSAVAQQQDVARSVVTRQIAALETHLGTKLIARSTRRLSLTSAGAAYLEKCREILPLVDAAEADMTAERQAPRGRIRLTLPLSFGVNRVMPLLGEFMAEHPEIGLELDFNDRRSNLIEGGFDLAIRISSRLDPGDVARKIGRSMSVVVASPEYIAKHGKPAHPRDLANHECFGYLLASRSSWPFLIDGTEQWFPVSGRLEANNGDALLEAAQCGLGIARAPTFIAENAVRAGRLVMLLPGFASPELGIYAVYPGSRYVPHRVRVLVDFLAQRIGERPTWDEIVRAK
jgi:DNA-binding transcriptional LysR family regulator